MINAGVDILSFDGNQTFDSTANIWLNIRLAVNYPEDQTSTANAVSVGDVIIEPNGNAWEVVALKGNTNNNFTVDVKQLNAQTSANVSPDMGVSSRGSIVTPNNGIIVPYWNASVVDAQVYRAAIGMSRFDKMVSSESVELDLGNL